MSEAVLADFNRIADSLSGEELVSAISILTEKLKKLFVKDESAERKNSKALAAFHELCAHADSLHLNSNGVKWTREEMNER